MFFVFVQYYSKPLVGNFREFELFKCACIMVRNEKEVYDVLECDLRTSRSWRPVSRAHTRPDSERL